MSDMFACRLLKDLDLNAYFTWPLRIITQSNTGVPTMLDARETEVSRPTESAFPELTAAQERQRHTVSCGGKRGMLGQHTEGPAVNKQQHIWLGRWPGRGGGGGKRNRQKNSTSQAWKATSSA